MYSFLSLLSLEDHYNVKPCIVLWLYVHFSFLASSGLLKKASSSTVAAACPSRQSSEAQGNGPVSPPAASVPPAALSPSLVSLREDQTCSSLEPDTTECTLTQAQKIERAR